MTEIHDNGILALYILARQDFAAGVTDTQKHAIEQIKKISRDGNADATAALHLLMRLPDMHPFLREMLAA